MRLMLVLLSLLPLLAQQGRDIGPIPSYEVSRAAGQITVDGKLDEAAWRSAGVLELQFPWEQRGAKQKTRARLLWNDQYLYVGYDCDDDDVVAHFQKRDDPTYRDDAVEFFVNPSPSEKVYYGLEMNARAVLYDYIAPSPVHFIKRLDFTGVQLASNVRGTLNQSGDKDQGWSLEVAIPWENFEELVSKLPPEEGSEFTANLNRWDGTAPNRRLSIWSDSGLDRPHPHNPDRFGRLVFVK